MKVITEITRGYEVNKEVHTSQPFHTLKDLNLFVMKVLYHDLDNDLPWEEGKRSLYEWLDGANIDTQYFTVEQNRVLIDIDVIPIDDFVKFKNLWNRTFGEHITFEFSVCF